MKKLALFVLLAIAVGCQPSQDTATLSGGSGISTSGTSGDPFTMLAVPTNPELKKFSDDFKSKFNVDAKQAIMDLGFWDSLSDVERERNLQEFSADLGKTIEGDIKTIDFKDWDADEYGFTPDIDGYSLTHTPSHIMYFKSKDGPVSTDAYFAVYFVTGRYYLGTAKSN